MTEIHNSMAFPASSTSVPPEDGGSSSSTPPVNMQSNMSSSPDNHEELEGDSEVMTVANLCDEDAHSLIELSISGTASRLKAPATPAIEKMAAMEEYGGYYFDSDPETPPDDTASRHPTPENVQVKGESPRDGDIHKRVKGMSLGEPPKPLVDIPDLPIIPWHAGPKPLVVKNGEIDTQGALHGVFANTRTRSLSGGAEALKRLLPKGLPSMAQVGNLFNSSNGHQKVKFGSSSNLAKDIEGGHQFQSDSSAGLPSSDSTIQPQMYESVVTTRHPQSLRQGAFTSPQRPPVVRRVTSHDSLLYHSLSRASSLGDDSRFENQREQVNSRAKAIRDSLQDRSSFRMPQIPNIMPSMPRVPSFNFNMNFLNANTVTVKWKPDADPISDILPGTSTKKKQNISNPAVASGMVGAAISEPEIVSKTAPPVAEGPNASYFDQALKDLTGDIVIMGGYRGSILRSAKTHRQLWAPVKVGLNIRKADLEVGLEPEDEERMLESIYPSGMLQNIGPVDISKRLFKRLAESENARNGKLRVWDYGYDWRLSPHLLSRKLTEFLENLPSNQASGGNTGALVIAHSLGGLITRHVVNRRPELFSGVIYAGVPKACVNILGPLRNGDAVLLSSRVLTAQVNFTLRTSFVLLPEDGRCFIDINTKEQYLVDFFDVNDWIKYRWSPCTDPPLPPRNNQPSGLGTILNLSLPISSMKSIIGPPSPKETGSNKSREQTTSPTIVTRAADTIRNAEGTDRTLAPQMGSNTNPVSKGQSTNQSVSTTVTIPRDKAIAYLKRTLAETKKFKQELYFNPSLSESNRYPPLALLYGKSIPTVFGAKVDGREGIACSDSYDNLAFASGDGVCLAKEAMLPEGYKVVYGGRISSDRGHVTLLGDLNAVGRAISAVVKGRKKGIGLGLK